MEKNLHMLTFYPAHKKKEISFLVQGIIDVFFVSSESPITLFCVQNAVLQTPKRQPTFSTRLDFNFSSVIHLLSDRKQLCFQIRVYLIDFVLFFLKVESVPFNKKYELSCDFLYIFSFYAQVFYINFQHFSFLCTFIIFKLKSNK